MTFLKPRMAKARSTDEDGNEKISAAKTAGKIGLAATAE